MPMSFRARFGGVPFDVWVPMKSMMGIYARETGQGMIFSHDTDNSDEPSLSNDSGKATTSSRRARVPKIVTFCYPGVRPPRVQLDSRGLALRQSWPRIVVSMMSHRQ